MGFFGRIFGKKENADSDIPELDLGKYPGMEQGPGLGAPTEMGGMAPPSHGLTEMPMSDDTGMGMGAGNDFSAGRMQGGMSGGMQGGMSGGMRGEMPTGTGFDDKFNDDIGQAPPAPIPGMGRSSGSAGRVQMQMPAPSSFAPAQVMPTQGYDASRDMQVVNAKLDTLKVLLDSINSKIDRLEQKQPREEEPVSLSVRRWR